MRPSCRCTSPSRASASPLSLIHIFKVNHGDIVRLGETRLRVQSRNRHDTQSSSIFSFKEAEADLSQSIVLSVSEIRNQALSVEALTIRLNAIIQVSKALANICLLYTSRCV